MRRTALACFASLVLLTSVTTGVVAAGSPAPTALGPTDTQMATATVSFANQTSGGTTVVVRNVTLPDGGFVAVHDRRLTDGKPFASVVGVSPYLSPGTHHNVTVRLYSPIRNETTLIAMPHRDTDGNHVYEFVSSNGQADGPYTADGSPVVDPATVQASATVRFGTQQTDGTTVVLDRVELAAGGFVAVHNGSLMQGKPKQSVVGHSTYLSPGVHRNVRIALSAPISENQTLVAMPHRDTNGNRQFDFVSGSADAPYTHGMAPVTDPARVTVSNQSTVRLGPQPTGGNRVVVRSVFLPDGGFIAVHDANLTKGEPRQSVVGHSSYLRPGLHRNVPVTLDEPVSEDQTLVAMPHHDTNGNRQFDFVSGSGDAPYTKGGAPVTDAANVTVSASVSFPAQRSDGRHVVVPVADLSSGGFLVVHSPLLGTGKPVASVVGHSDYLAPGVHRNVTITLSRPVNETQRLTAMAHRDTNDNQAYDFGTSSGADAPYTVSGHPVVDSGSVAVTAAVTFQGQSTNGEKVVVRSVTLTHGGFVAIHNASLTQGKPFASVVGSSAYLEAGTHRNVTVHLDAPLGENQTLIAMPHYDTNGNRQYDFATSHGGADPPYLGAGGPVVDPASIGVTGSQMTSTTTSMATTTTTTTTSSMTTTTAMTTAGTTSSGQPGFGLVVGLLALLGAALVALWRDDE